MNLDARASGALIRQVGKTHAILVQQRMTAAGFPDLTSAHARLLALMDQEEMVLGRFARLAGVTRQALRHPVDRLAVLGYAEIRSVPEDTRAKKVALSARGRIAREAARKVLREADTDWSRLLEPADWEHLAVYLNRLASRMESRDLTLARSTSPGPGEQRLRRGTIAEGALCVLREVGGRATTKEITSRLVSLGRLKPGPRASTVLTNSLSDKPKSFVRVARGIWVLVGSGQALEA